MPSNLMSSIHTNLKETPGGVGMIVTGGISSNLNGVVFMVQRAQIMRKALSIITRLMMPYIPKELADE
jgi:hypothetical protein